MIIAIGLRFIGFSQDYAWWNEANNWDGQTHWHEYLTISPAYLGPNALPIPDIHTGQIPTETYLKLAVEKHWSDGDETENLFADVFVQLFNERVGLRLYMVPIEHYEYDAETRDDRSSRDFDGTGIAVGDVYVSTLVQLIKENQYFPDVLLSLNLKTASGNKLSAARFTDTPAYFFDLSMGKEFTVFDNPNFSLRPYLLAGFYVWQTFDDRYYQNDAFLYGVGIDMCAAKINISNAFGAYSGYIGNGDNPSVYRLKLASKFDSKFNGALCFQQGFRDNYYRSIRLSLRYSFK